MNSILSGAARRKTVPGVVYCLKKTNRIRSPMYSPT